MDYLSIATWEGSAQSIHSIPETLAKKKYKTVYVLQGAKWHFDTPHKEGYTTLWNRLCTKISNQMWQETQRQRKMLKIF
jgi:hypothetical protein